MRSFFFFFNYHAADAQEHPSIPRCHLFGAIESGRDSRRANIAV